MKLVNSLLIIFTLIILIGMLTSPKAGLKYPIQHSWEIISQGINSTIDQLLHLGGE